MSRLLVVLVVGVAGCLARVPASVDVNTAGAARIAALPGVDGAAAARIVGGRPYWAKDDLVRRGIVDPTTYAAIADRILVGPPATPPWLAAVPPMPQSP